MSIDLASLKNKKVLVTGADGFIGSHVVEALLSQGAETTAFCMYNSFGTLGWLDGSSTYGEAVAAGQARSVLGDIRDTEHVNRVVAGHDVVLHLAALIAIPHSYVAARSYVDTNITGTVNVLEACREHSVSRLVHTSTSEVYGTPEHVPISESHPLKGQSPYSATKIGADKMCESYARSFDVPVTILRPFNTYGPRQSARALIPTVLAQLQSGVNEIQLGALTPQRDFTYVTDTAEGFLKAAIAQADPGQVIQLGTGRTVSVQEVVDICQTVTGTSVVVSEDPNRIRPAKSEVEILLSNPSLADKVLDWRPSVSLEEGLSRTSDWVRDNFDLSKAGMYHT